MRTQRLSYQNKAFALVFSFRLVFPRPQIHTHILTTQLSDRNTPNKASVVNLQTINAHVNTLSKGKKLHTHTHSQLNTS